MLKLGRVSVETKDLTPVAKPFDSQYQRYV